MRLQRKQDLQETKVKTSRVRPWSPGRDLNPRQVAISPANPSFSSFNLGFYLSQHFYNRIEVRKSEEWDSNLHTYR